MKTKRNMIILLVVLVASLFMVAAVSADTVAGTGWIRAHGQGQARLHGNLARVNVSGNGVLWYKDGGEEDKPRVTGNGRRIDYPNGWVQYIGFNGTFTVNRADDFSVILIGKEIDLFAAGRGVVHLEGRGHYVVGNGETVMRGNWHEAGQTINLEEGPIQE